MAGPAKPAKNAKKIFYIGADDGYLQTIRERFQRSYPNDAFDFPQIRPKDPRAYQRIFAHLVTQKPTIIYIDFSFLRDAQLKLAQLLTRENSLKTVPIIGLVEEKEHVRDCLSSGVSITHVKCGEYHDVIYDAMLLASPKTVTKPQFAKAKFSKSVELIDDFRVGYMTKDAIHAEGNIELKPGDQITMHLDLPASVLPSKNFVVKVVDNKNLYYDFKYSYELQYVFVDKPELSESEQLDQLGEDDPKVRAQKEAQIKKKIKEKQVEYEDMLGRTKRKIRDWVASKSDGSAPKKTRILIVDQGMTVMSGERLVDEYPYAIRFQTHLSQGFQELMRIRPNIVAFQFLRDDLYEPKTDWLLPKKKETEAKELTLEEQELRESIREEESEKARQELIRLISFIKEMQDYNPFLIIFNCDKYTSTSFQESFKYPLVLTHKSSVDLGIITHMAQVLEKKQEASYNQKLEAKIKSLKAQDPMKYRNLKPADFEEVRFYIRKDNPLSHGSFHYPVTLETLTESELTFSTDVELDLTSFRLDFPVPMSIALVPDSEGKKFVSNGKQKTYRALIHSVDETDKKAIRRYVNEIFFDPVNQKRAKEQEAFKAVQEKAIKAREEEAKKREEEKNQEERRNDELISEEKTGESNPDEDPEPLT